MNAIKEKRKEINATQESIANELGWSRKTYIKWETGKMSKFDVSELKRLQEILGLSFDEIINSASRKGA